MSRAFTADDGALLQAHLVALANVELFTVPVYLTAVYSFTGAALGYGPSGVDPSNTPYGVQQKALSVAVQEMYHAQLACNLANAFQVSPVLDVQALSLPAKTTLTVPHLDPQGQDLQLTLGNMSDMIKAMIAVETPDPGNFPAPNSEVLYASISDLYNATLTLLAAYLDAHANSPDEMDPSFKGDNLQVAAKTFLARYLYNAAAKAEDVEDMVNAITDQGEGKIIPDANTPPAVAAHFGSDSGDSDAVDPNYQSAKGSRFYAYDGITHYGRFEAIQSTLKAQMQTWETAIAPAPVFYPGDGTKSPDLPSWAKEADASEYRKALGYAWSYLIDSIQATVRSPQPAGPGGQPPDFPADFYSTMFALKYLIPLVWQTGNCPGYTYTPGVTFDQLQTLLGQIDPYCLMHWDAQSIELRNNAAQGKTYTATLPNGTTVTQTYQFNACQGLNVCATQGWGGVATQPGDGACATADIHSCQGGNSCQYQGGCGFITSSLPASENWVPGQNACSPNPQNKLTSATGGCQTPISAGQYFDSNPTFGTGPGWSSQDVQPLKELENTPVWDRARDLLASRLSLTNLPSQFQQVTSGGVTDDGTNRRKSVPPTSPQTTSTSGGDGGSGDGGAA